MADASAPERCVRCGVLVNSKHSDDVCKYVRLKARFEMASNVRGMMDVIEVATKAFDPQNPDPEVRSIAYRVRSMTHQFTENLLETTIDLGGTTDVENDKLVGGDKACLDKLTNAIGSLYARARELRLLAARGHIYIKGNSAPMMVFVVEVAPDEKIEGGCVVTHTVAQDTAEQKEIRDLGERLIVAHAAGQQIAEIEANRLEELTEAAYKKFMPLSA